VHVSLFICICNPNIYHAQENVEIYSEDSSIQSSFSKIHQFPLERKEVRYNFSIGIKINIDRIALMKSL